MRKGLIIFGVVALIVLIAMSTVVQYNHSGVYEATVYRVTEQQHVSGSSGENGSDVSTSYRYMVSTDVGVFEIRPDGLFAANCFGSLEEGGRYRFTTRGFSVPLMGMYPYIITATPL